MAAFAAFLPEADILKAAPIKSSVLCVSLAQKLTSLQDQAMTRVRQSFTNDLTEDLVVFVEMECWCWLLKPGEKLTVDYDTRGFAPEWEPLPIGLSMDGSGADHRFMITLWQQGKTESSLFIDGAAIVIEGSLTPLGNDRFIGS
jgi:hypothetical protein